MQYWNDKWTDDSINVPANDLTVLRGYGVFDFVRTYNRVPFYLDEHIDRFLHSAQLLRLTCPKTKEEISDIIFEGIRRNEALGECYIKFLLTGGVCENSKGLTPGKSNFFVVFLPTSEYPQEYFTEGIKCITTEFERYLPKAKSLTYMTAIVTLLEAQDAGAHDVIYIDRHGNFLEGPTWNFFGVIDGKIICAPDNKILTGITAMFVEKAAQKLGIELEKRDFSIHEIESLSEAFATSTTKGVMPITTLNSKPIGGTGKVGPIATQLMELLKEEAAHI